MEDDGGHEPMPQASREAAHVLRVSRRGGGGYGAVLATAGARRLVVASLLGRLPLGMGPLALILVVGTGGRAYAVAALSVTAYTAGIAVGQPFAGRALDEGGTILMLPFGLAFAVLTVAAGLSAFFTNWSWTPVLLAGFSGAALPPLGACVRAAWPRLLPSAELYNAAYSLESTLQETVFLIGPLVVAGLASVGGPLVALLTSAASGACGAALIAGSPYANTRGQVRRHGSGSPVRSPALQTLMRGTVAIGAAYGSMVVLMPAFVASQNAPRSAAGVPLAALAVGSVCAGLLSPARGSPGARYLCAVCVCPAALVPLALAPSVALAVPAAFVAGLPTAPTFAAAYTLISEFITPIQRAEAFSWMTTAAMVGEALGTAGANVGIRLLGASDALAVPAAVAVVGAFLALLSRNSLTRPIPDGD